MYTLAKGISEV